MSELGLRIADLEAATQTNGPRSAIHIQQKLDEKIAQLDAEIRSRQEAQKVQRRSERMVRDLQHQLLEKDKLNARHQEEAVKSEQKMKGYRQRIEELVRMWSSFERERVYIHTAPDVILLALLYSCYIPSIFNIR